MPYITIMQSIEHKRRSRPAGATPAGTSPRSRPMSSRRSKTFCFACALSSTNSFQYKLFKNNSCTHLMDFARKLANQRAFLPKAKPPVTLNMTRERPGTFSGPFPNFPGRFSGTFTALFRECMAQKNCLGLDFPFPAPGAPQRAQKD